MSAMDTALARHSPRSDTGGLIAELVDFWHDLLKTMFDSYHPERHYMRGPGPACARKRASPIA